MAVSSFVDDNSLYWVFVYCWSQV